MSGNVYSSQAPTVTVKYRVEPGNVYSSQAPTVTVKYRVEPGNAQNPSLIGSISDPLIRLPLSTPLPLLFHRQHNFHVNTISTFS
jgi:hypothetical protein